MEFTISNEELQELNQTYKAIFPKYASQLMNLANQNAQGTRPNIVGQLSDLFPQYQNETNEISLESWREWYLDRYPNAIENATNRIFDQSQNLKEVIKLIDREMIYNWVDDLVITKTYNGLYVQKAILAKLSEIERLPYRMSTPKEESIGIDGIVGDVAYSIKPNTYKTMARLSERISVKMIYYTKTKDRILVEVED